MQTDDSKKDQPPVHPLDYRSDPSLSAGRCLAATLEGILLSIVSILGGVPLVFLSFGSGPIVGIIICAVMVAAAIYTLVIRFRGDQSLTLEDRRRKRRFFIIGLLIGGGVGILLEGLCFATISKI